MENAKQGCIDNLGVESENMNEIQEFGDNNHSELGYAINLDNTCKPTNLHTEVRGSALSVISQNELNIQDSVEARQSNEYGDGDSAYSAPSPVPTRNIKRIDQNGGAYTGIIADRAAEDDKIAINEDQIADHPYGLPSTQVNENQVPQESNIDKIDLELTYLRDISSQKLLAPGSAQEQIGQVSGNFQALDQELLDEGTNGCTDRRVVIESPASSTLSHDRDGGELLCQNEGGTRQVTPLTTNNHSNVGSVGGSQNLQQVDMHSINSESVDDSFSSEEISDHQSSSTHSSIQGGPTRNKGKKKSMCARFSIFNSKCYLLFQILLAISYFVLLLVCTIMHSKVYAAQNEFNQLKNEPTEAAKKDAVFASLGCAQVRPLCSDGGCFGIGNNDYTERIYELSGSASKLARLEIGFLIIIVIDLVGKLYNDRIIKQEIESRMVREVTKEAAQSHDQSMEMQGNSYKNINVRNGQLIVFTSALMVDLALSLIMIVLYVWQTIESNSEKQNFMTTGILMMSRSYLKFPIAIVLISHHMQLSQFNQQQNLVHPKADSVEFSSYKEKVLYIIKKIRKQFGKQIDLRQPNFDLAWCAFIIENDYLQISNSISNSQFQALNFSKQNTSDMDKEDLKKIKDQAKRRFSKTIPANFGQRNTKSNATIVIKKTSKIAELLCKDQPVDSSNENLKNMNTYFFTNNYNAFEINNAVEGNLLTFNLLYCYQKFDWKSKIPQLDEQLFKNLAYKLQMSYRDNYYHSQIHAADVVNHLSYLMYTCGVKDICQLTDQEVFVTLISGAAHDMDHPGTNNMLEIKTRSKLATLYNDQSVLEHHHAASFYFMIENSKQDCNIMEGFTVPEQLQMRKDILENILCTDMSKHGAIQTDIKALCETVADDRALNGDNKRKLLKALVHASDINNVTRPFDIAKEWGIRCVKEFFHQGDKERSLNLEISMLCDRNTTNFPKCQMGFSQFMVLPYFQMITQLVPKVKQSIDDAKATIEVYKTLLDEYDEYMKDGNRMF